METLWAPWRLEFITGKREPGCVFCTKPSEARRLRENLVLHRGRLAFVILNRYPYHSGHLMVIPLRHTSRITDLTGEENAELSLLTQVSVRALEGAYRPDGFNLGTNLGRAAGAGIEEHLHHHVIPRWIGDTNFFPIISQTRSLPECLDDTYGRLRPHFREAERSGEIAPGGHDEAEREPDKSAEGTA